MNRPLAVETDYELKRKLVAVDIGELLSMDIPPREMLLAPILPRQGLVMAYSKRGLGKTHLALNIAYAVASGGQFLRWKAPKPARVLLIDGEMPLVALQDRLASVVAGGSLLGRAKRPAPLLDVPAGWLAGVETLQDLDTLGGWTDQEWRQVQADATAFLATWGAQAHGLGWTALDLFGCHPSAPRASHDAMGLVLLLQGHSIVTMDDQLARIETRAGVSWRV